jgi:sulfatase maturation enzyme AslB (radical SAM superfamily)
MPNPNIFCNSPWYELHVFWDGALGFCCHANPNVPYDPALKSQYNIKNMSIREWYDSEPMRQARLIMHGDTKWSPHCGRCWHEESVSATSRRHRSNQKSVIFRQNFQESYLQSPGWSKFEHSAANHGEYQGLPIDLHIDLGNYCNLACKMCNAEASSTIATQHRKWGLLDKSLQDWTLDSATWTRFKQELLEIPGLKNIHFMGGETLIQPKFSELIDHLIDHDKRDVCISFVTNGTSFDAELVKKFKHFERVGIEVSIESLDVINDYVRQGTDTSTVKENINKYLEHCDGSSITVTLRPAPSALTVRSYWQVIEYALQNQMIIKSNLVTRPAFMNINVLPDRVKQQYKMAYWQVFDQHGLQKISDLGDHNESDPNNYKLVAKNQILQIINMLDSVSPAEHEQLLEQLVVHMKKWDQVYNFNAVSLYPELTDTLINHGY